MSQEPVSPERQKELAAIADKRRLDYFRAVAVRRPEDDVAAKKLVEQVRASYALKAQLASEVRQSGKLDLTAIMRSPVQRGALAMLEADGEVVLGQLQHDGTATAMWIESDKRAAIVKRRRAAQQAAMLKPRRPAAEESRDSG